MASLNNLTKVNITKAKAIYSETFFRVLAKNVEIKEAWPVNIQMLIKNERRDILCGLFKPEYFKGKETHVSIINLDQDNTMSVPLKEALLRLFRISRKSDFKYTIYIEYSNHDLDKLRLDVDFKNLLNRVKKENWWRFIFINEGPKTIKVPPSVPLSSLKKLLGKSSAN